MFAFVPQQGSANKIPHGRQGHPPALLIDRPGRGAAFDSSPRGCRRKASAAGNQRHRTVSSTVRVCKGSTSVPAPPVICQHRPTPTPSRMRCLRSSPSRHTPAPASLPPPHQHAHLARPAGSRNLPYAPSGRTQPDAGGGHHRRPAARLTQAPGAGMCGGGGAAAPPRPSSASPCLRGCGRGIGRGEGVMRQKGNMGGACSVHKADSSACEASLLPCSGQGTTCADDRAPLRLVPAPAPPRLHPKPGPPPLPTNQLFIHAFASPAGMQARTHARTNGILKRLCHGPVLPLCGVCRRDDHPSAAAATTAPGTLRTRASGLWAVSADAVPVRPPKAQQRRAGGYGRGQTCAERLVCFCGVQGGRGGRGRAGQGCHPCGMLPLTAWVWREGLPDPSC